jgi:hypothetical protein
LTVVVLRLVVFLRAEVVFRAAVVFRAVVFFREEALFLDEPDEDVEDDFASPDSARCLLTVRAAISFARFAERPPFFSSDSLTCSYCRSRFALHASGIRATSCDYRAVDTFP